MLAWLIQEVTGHPFQDAVTQEFWQHIGAESDAGFFAYRYGIAVPHGGFQARMRDLARFGLLFTPSASVVTDKEIIGDEFIDLMRSDGNPKLRGDWQRGTTSYPMYQWNVIESHDWIEHGGWGGQGLMISPSRDVVALFTSYTKDDGSEVELGAVMFDLLNTVFSEIPAEP
jgi:CubicO group peptidase (beta-lactamase class C family)